MRCSELKSKIDRYIDDTLPSGQRSDVSGHLKQCTSCRNEVEWLRRIQNIAAENLYSGPEEDYWDQLPAKIVSRVSAKQKPAVGSNLVEYITGFLLPKWRYGAAIAAVTVLSVIFISRFSTEESLSVADAPAPVNNKTGIEESQSSVSVGTARTPEVVSTPVAEKNFVEQPQKDVVPQEPIDLPPVQALPMNTEMLAGTGFKLPAYIVPSVNVPWPVQEMEKLQLSEGADDDDRTVLGALALQQSGKILKAPVPEQEMEEAELPQGSFNETMWIVQQSKSLEEKRNIWLSYINRETNTTYKSLGVYHLALILTEMVEKQREPELASKAEEFFMEHRQILQQLMGAGRYERKMMTLKTIKAF